MEPEDSSPHSQAFFSVYFVTEYIFIARSR